MSAWLILVLHWVSNAIDGLTDDLHLTTDPACYSHVAPRRGSRLDRASRGVSCIPCMITRSWFGE